MDFAAWLTYLGITPQQLVPLILVGGILSFLAWKYFLKDMKSEVTGLHNSTREIQKYIEDRDEEWNPQFLLRANPIYSAYGENHSPIVPDTKGNRLLRDSHFNEQYPKLKNELFEVMDKMELRTLYDYERGAKRALRQLQDDPLFDPIKDYSVNHPDVSLSVIFTVAAWMIRDDYAEHKEKPKTQ